MSLRITPASTHPTSTTNTAPSKLSSQPSHQTYPSAPSAPGLPDTLRASLSSSSSFTTTSSPATSTPIPSSTHPLESRLQNWTATQQTLQHNLLRRTHGLAEPLRRSMELHLVRSSDSFRPSCLGLGSSVHDDILSNRDAEISWEDIYAGQDGARVAEGSGGDGAGAQGWHGEMERAVGMGKW